MGGLRANAVVIHPNYANRVVNARETRLRGLQAPVKPSSRPTTAPCKYFARDESISAEWSLRAPDSGAIGFGAVLVCNAEGTASAMRRGGADRTV